MISELTLSSAKLLINWLTNNETGEVPWYLTCCYMYVNEGDLFSCYGDYYRRTFYSKERDKFVIQMFKGLKSGNRHMYNEMDVSSLSSKGERYFTTLAGAELEYKKSLNYSVNK